MRSLPDQTMTVDEFLPWAERQPKGRYELHDGKVILMFPERAAHWKTKAAVFLALRNAIAEAALQCHAVPDGATVRILQSTACEPDALVYCGEEVPADAVEVPNPVIVVEVLSPSTQAGDRKDKLMGYFAVPSVHHYLIVDPEKKLVIHHRRTADATLSTRIASEGELRLYPPGLTLGIPELFA